VADILVQVPDTLVSASAVARVLGMMNSTHAGLDDAVAIQSLLSEGASWEKKPDGGAKEAVGWAVENFVDAVKARIPALSWREVIAQLDYQGFDLVGVDGLDLIVRAYRRAEAKPFPMDLLFRPWTNTTGQLSIMRLLSDPRVAAHPEVSILTSAPMTRLPTEGLKSISGGNNTERMLSLWTSLDYLRCMMHLGESGHYQDVITLLEPVMGLHPDVLALGITVACPGVWGAIQRDIAAAILPTFMEPGPNSSLVLSRVFAARKEVCFSSLFPLNPSCSLPGDCRKSSSVGPALTDQSCTTQVVLSTILSWYSADPNSPRLVRILDVVQDIKGLLHVLKAPQPAFVLDLAILASHRGFLNLEKWLVSQMNDRGDVMIGPSVIAAEAILSNQPAGGASNAFHQSAHTILEVLHSNADKGDDMARAKVARLLEVYAPKKKQVGEPEGGTKDAFTTRGMPTAATPADTPDGGVSLTGLAPAKATGGTWPGQYPGEFQAGYSVQTAPPAAVIGAGVPVDFATASSALQTPGGGLAVNPMDTVEDGSADGDYSNRLFSKPIDDEANSYVCAFTDRDAHPSIARFDTAICVGDPGTLPSSTQSNSRSMMWWRYFKGSNCRPSSTRMTSLRA
jgi:hypothetical protein